MKNRNYKVRRDNVYVGDVCGINPEEIRVIHEKRIKFDVWKKFYSEEKFKKICRGYAIEKQLFEWDENGLITGFKKDQLNYHSAFYYHISRTRFWRSMLFTLDENKHANDLLYDSPHYPILNISDNIDCISSTICVCHYTYQLEELLKYFGYPEELTFDDILKIRQTFFSVDWFLDNHQLFGYKETGINETGHEMYDSAGHHRTFNDWDDEDNSVFPHDWFEINRLRDRIDGEVGEDYSKTHTLSNVSVINRFKPCEEEEKEQGPIKSLGSLF